jgi:multiple sugar transport system permease protein
MAETQEARGAERGAAPLAGARAAPFVAPALAVLCGANVLPLLWSIGISFFHFRADRLHTPPHFLGFANYLDLMSDPDVR